jgi:hypothetical protein
MDRDGSKEDHGRKEIDQSEYPEEEIEEMFCSMMRSNQGLQHNEAKQGLWQKG